MLYEAASHFNSDNALRLAAAYIKLGDSRRCHNESVLKQAAACSLGFRVLILFSDATLLQTRFKQGPHAMQSGRACICKIMCSNETSKVRLCGVLGKPP